MSIIAFTLLLLSCTVYGHQDESILIDGPCPTPAPKDNFKAQDLDGIWYDVYTDYAMAKAPFNNIIRSCIQNKLTLESTGNIIIDTRYTDPSGEFTLHKRFVPVEGKSGVYDIQKKQPDGGWKEHGWRYTFEGFSADSFLEFACKLNGTQHYEFHRIRSRSNDPSDAEIQSLKQIAVDHDNDHDHFVKINHENCTYSLE